MWWRSRVRLRARTSCYIITMAMSAKIPVVFCVGGLASRAVGEQRLQALRHVPWRWLFESDDYSTVKTWPTVSGNLCELGSRELLT